MATLAHLLRTNNVLFSLELNGEFVLLPFLIAFTANDLGADDIAELAEALKGNTALTNLSLYDNELGDEGVALVAEALLFNKTLQDLNLGSKLTVFIYSTSQRTMLEIKEQSKLPTPYRRMNK